MMWIFVLCLFFCIILTPIRFDICYNYNGEFKVNLYFFGFKRQVNSKVKKNSNNKKKDQKKCVIQKKNKIKLYGIVRDISFWGTRIHSYFRLLKKLLPFCFRLKSVRVQGAFFCGSMALTGIVSGLIYSLLFYGKTCSVNIDLVPDFCEEKTKVEFFASGYVWVVGLLICGFAFSFKFLSDLARFRGGK